MSDPSQPMDPPAGWSGLAYAAWPRRSPGDSPASRRKKLAVRGGHLGMVILVAVAVTGSLVFGAPDRPVAANLALVASAVAYLGWNLVGSRSLVRLVLSDVHRPARVEDRRPVTGPIVYFGVQLSLASAVYWLGDLGRLPNLVWLALLPPVAYAVFFLRWRGIALVTMACVGILWVGVLHWHGWRGVPYAVPAFSVAVLFTLVFTLLVVSAESARHQAQALADELRAVNDQLRRNAVEREELAATRERNRLAREIHDSLGHYLTVVHMQLQAALALEGTRPERAREALTKACTLTSEGLREVRESVATLRASPLDHRRLGEALREMIDRHRAGGLEGRFTVHGDERPLAPAAALTLYRAGQEGLTNVQKHSRARHVDVTLDYRDPDRVRLRTVDDGVGPGSGNPGETGFGLLGLRERVQLLGGNLSTSPAPNGGFVLEVEVPG